MIEFVQSLSKMTTKEKGLFELNNIADIDRFMKVPKDDLDSGKQ